MHTTVHLLLILIALGAGTIWCGSCMREVKLKSIEVEREIQLDRNQKLYDAISRWVQKPDKGIL